MTSKLLARNKSIKNSSTTDNGTGFQGLPGFGINNMGGGGLSLSKILEPHELSSTRTVIPQDIESTKTILNGQQIYDFSPIVSKTRIDKQQAILSGLAGQSSLCSNKSLNGKTHFIVSNSNMGEMKSGSFGGTDFIQGSISQITEQIPVITSASKLREDIIKASKQRHQNSKSSEKMPNLSGAF